MSAVIIPQWFSTGGLIFPPRGPIKMSGDILFEVVTAGRVCDYHQRPEDASEQPAIYRIASHDKELFVLKYH